MRGAGRPPDSGFIYVWLRFQQQGSITVKGERVGPCCLESSWFSLSTKTNMGEFDTQGFVACSNTW